MSKLPTVGTSIFSVMSKMAAEYGAINLSQGFPNFPIDNKLTEIQLRIVSEGQSNQYCPMMGHPLLLEGLQKLIYQSYGRTVDIANELLVTAGATQAIYTIFQALTEQGDEVIVLDPCYDSYEPAILLSGAKPVHVPLNDAYLPDWNRIESMVNDKTKFLLINNPHNPSGRVWLESDFDCLEQLMGKYPKLLILSDEVYEFITFEKKHISINERPKIRERALSVSSFGKTFHITGWKVGYVVAPQFLMDEIKKVHQFLVFSVNSIAQASLAAYLNEVNVQELGRFYQQKRDLFSSLLKGSSFELLPSEGTYFQLASYKAISNEDDLSFTKRILIEHQIATIPVSVFNNDGRDLKHIRLCFAKTDETLKQAAEKLNQIS